jgi:hypothetical protein
MAAEYKIIDFNILAAVACFSLDISAAAGKYKEVKSQNVAPFFVDAAKRQVLILQQEPQNCHFC